MADHGAGSCMVTHCGFFRRTGGPLQEYGAKSETGCPKNVLWPYSLCLSSSLCLLSISVKRQENKVFHHGSSLINYCLLNLMLTDPQRMYYLLLPTMESPIFYHHCNLLIEDICSSEAATRCLVRPCSPACSLHQQYSTLWSRVIQRLQFSSVSGHRCRHQHLQ